MPEIEKSFLSSEGNLITYQVIYSNNRQLQVKTSHARNKTAIFLVHGLASNMTRWSEFILNTKILESNDIVRLDLRGHGKSIVHDRVTINKWCHDLFNILTIENYPNAIIIGHSLGAQIAINFSVLYPDSTAGLILIDPIYPSALKGILKFVKNFRFMLLILIYILLIKSKLFKRKKKYLYRDLFELDLKTRTLLQQQPKINIAKLYMSPKTDLKYIPLLIYCQDLYEVTRDIPELNNIICPVLGLLSKGASVSNIKNTKFLLKQFKNNDVVVINANHWLLTEKPLESRTAIDQWCCKLIK